MTELLINTSISDAIDRLTILNVKTKKIVDDEKQKEIKIEKELLLNKLKPFLKDTVNYYCDILEKINMHIWELLDIAKYSNQTPEQELKYYREQEDYNERRFRVKRMIDNYLSSSIKEQKGYTNKRCCVLTHLGLGDHMYHGGMIRYLATVYDKIILVCYDSNMENLKLIFSDILNIIEFWTTPWTSSGHHSEIDKVKNYTKENNIDEYFTGMYIRNGPDKIYDYPFSWYDTVKIKYSVFWEYNYIPKSDKSDEVYNYVKDMKYIFMHNTCSGGKIYNTSLLEKEFSIDRNEILFINPCVNIYEKGHKFFDIAEKFLVYKLCDYITTIENAEIISLTDSSFFGMVMHLQNIKTDHTYYYQRGTDYEHIFENEKYKSNNPKLKRFKKLNRTNILNTPPTCGSHVIGGSVQVRNAVMSDKK